MKAEITVTRTPGEIPHEITLSVEEFPCGTIEALPIKTVWQRKFFPPMWPWSDGEREEFTDYDSPPIATEGVDFELEPEEIEEAKKAIASNQAAYYENIHATVVSHYTPFPKYHDIFPLAGLSPHEEGK